MWAGPSLPESGPSRHLGSGFGPHWWGTGPFMVVVTLGDLTLMPQFPLPSSRITIGTSPWVVVKIKLAGTFQGPRALPGTG